MKRFLLAALLLFAGTAQAADTPRTLQKVVVWVQSKDPQLGLQIEQLMRSELAGRQVDARSFTELFSSAPALSPTALINQLQQQGFDAFLSVRPRGAIRWTEPAGKDGKAAVVTLSSFLHKYVRSARTGTEPMDVDPIQDPIVDQMPPMGTPGNQPIPGNSGQTSWQIVKGTAIVFDVKSGQTLWKDNLTLRIPKDLPMARYQKRVAEDVRDALTASKLIPPGRR